MELFTEHIINTVYIYSQDSFSSKHLLTLYIIAITISASLLTNLLTVIIHIQSNRSLFTFTLNL